MSLVKSEKGHVCPPSNAKHPSDRWESLFIYSFICKFTNLRGKVEGLDSPMDLENALLSREPNPILSQVLSRFILNLRPQTRNLSTDQISSTVAAVLSDYCKSSERTIFWNDELKMNVDPFHGLEGGIFTVDWDFKLKILRQLVELQLCHNPDIKGKIDRAWGVSQNKHKKKDAATAPPDPTDPYSQDNLQLVPIGQDSSRKRYWVADNSPRIYVSTNPWKITATFQTISSTREEFIAAIENLKASAPPEPRGREKRSKLETSHLALVKALNERIELVDAELARVQKAQRKIEQRIALYAQAELRETRTRRQTRKPDYVYTADADSEEEGGDEYAYQEDEVYDEEFEDDDFLNFRDEAPNGTRRQASSSNSRRRSTRTTVLNSNNKREAEEEPWSNWRGERRSSRLGAPTDTQLDVEPPPKRARTADSTMSSASAVDLAGDAASSASPGPDQSLRLKSSSAAALKPTEIALEQIKGKKRSKYWVYAVEPIPGAAPPPPDPGLSNGAPSNGMNGHATNGDKHSTPPPAPPPPQDSSSHMDSDMSMEGSLSPSPYE